MVYSSRCGTCEAEYVGETIRPLATRIKEHKDSVMKKNTKSALGEHVINNPGHDIEFEKVKVIDSECRNLQRKVKEAIHIRERNPSLNRQIGYELPWIYTVVLQGDKGGTKQGTHLRSINRVTDIQSLKKMSNQLSKI